MPASLELVKLAVQAYGDRYCEIALGMADPLIRWDERASRPDGELVWKRDAVQRAMRRYLDSWERYSFELEDLAEVSPGKVVGICRESGIDATGTPVDRRFGGLWVVEDGKIVLWSTYLTPREAVRAAKAAATSVRKPKAAEAKVTEGRKPTAEDKARAAKARAKLRKRQRQEAT
jgi:ketosteroid isomerase-like protein